MTSDEMDQAAESIEWTAKAVKEIYDERVKAVEARLAALEEFKNQLASAQAENVKQAVDAEREAIARMAEDHWCSLLAEKIRARGGK